MTNGEILVEREVNHDFLLSDTLPLFINTTETFTLYAERLFRPVIVLTGATKLRTSSGDVIIRRYGVVRRRVPAESETLRYHEYVQSQSLSCHISSCILLLQFLPDTITNYSAAGIPLSSAEKPPKSGSFTRKRWCYLI